MKRSRGAGGAGGAAGRKAPKVVNVTIHVHNNIHNYFAPREGPTAAPEGGDQHPPHLFPTTETTIRRRDKDPRHKRDTYMRVQSKRSGVLCGECEHCMNPSRPIADFAPAKHVKTLRDRAAFFEAVSDYADAYAARDLDAARAARDRVSKLRRGVCPPCTAKMKLSPAERACKDEWIKMRQDACDRHDGCMKEGCPWKGANRDWRVLQADHLPGYVKVRHLSNYKWWAGHGGVAAMRVEAAKCQWICGFCHNLEPTSDSARRCGDPDDMPDGKQGKKATKEEVKQYNAKRQAKIKYPKHQHVDAEKLKRKCCAKCNRTVTRETCAAFHFDHEDETTKLIGEDTLAGKQGGVSGLVRNVAKRAALDEIKDVLDAEMAKCKLLCANCHKLKTYDGEDVASDDEGDEE